MKRNLGINAKFGHQGQKSCLHRLSRVTDCLHSSGANFDENVTGSLGSLGYVKILHLVAKFGHQVAKTFWSHSDHVCPPGGQFKYYPGQVRLDPDSTRRDGRFGILDTSQLSKISVLDHFCRF